MVLPVVGDGSTKLPEPWEPWPEQAAAEQFLAKHQGSLASLHHAAIIQGNARFPTQFADNMGMTLKPLLEVRAAARLLALECEVRIRRGDFHAATESIDTIFASSRSLEPAPAHTAQIIRIVGDAAAISSLERLLSMADLADDDLAAIDSTRIEDAYVVYVG